MLHAFVHNYTGVSGAHVCHIVAHQEALLSIIGHQWTQLSTSTCVPPLGQEYIYCPMLIF
jgi:hypothetical protein